MGLKGLLLRRFTHVAVDMKLQFLTEDTRRSRFHYMGGSKHRVIVFTTWQPKSPSIGESRMRDARRKVHSFYDLVSEVMPHHFHLTLSIETRLLVQLIHFKPHSSIGRVLSKKSDKNIFSQIPKAMLTGGRKNVQFILYVFWSVF